MAERSIANLRSFGDMDSDVFVGPVGTEKPTGKASLASAPWEVLGWLGEDGAEEGYSVDVTKFKLFQGGKTGRTKANGTEKTMQVTAAETNPLVFELFYGTTEPAKVTAGVAEVEIPEGASTVARAAAFLYTDGDIWYVRYNTRAEVTDRGSVTYANTDLSTRQMTFDLVGKDYWLTNDPAFTGTDLLFA